MKFFIVLTCAFLSCSQEESNPLFGSWSMKEIHYIYTDTTYSLTNAHKGTFIFSPERYVIMYNPWKTERKPYEVLSKPKDEEILASFKTIVFNSGQYTYTDTTLTSTADIAKVPGFEGGKQFYKYSIKNKMLDITMFDETYPNGDKPEWYGKLNVRFILEKEEK